MFILCPHCQFLVAIDPASGLPPASCPRCGRSLRTETTVAEAPESPSPVPAQTPTPAEVDVEIEAQVEAEGTASRTTDSTERPLDADVLGELRFQGQTGVESPDAVEDAAAPERTSVIDATASDDTAMDDAEARVPEVVIDVATPAPAGPDVSPPAPAPAPAPRRRANAPSFARTPASTDRPLARRWSMLAIIAALSLLLMLQVLLADRAQLAMQARWRPALASLCGVLHCTLPAWHEPEAFTLVARDVRPARPGVLHVTATFRNDARWTQAWPALHLALQDVDGGTIGARVFAPSEYLGGHDTQNGLAPGQVASIAFDVAEPPGTVVAFTFDFL